MNYEQAKVRAEILKALSHPIRVLLVEALSKGEQCVSELNKLVAVDQSTISRHLAQLKKVGIIGEKREGAKVIHYLSCPCMLQAIECAVGVLKTESKRRSAILKGTVMDKGKDQ